MIQTSFYAPLSNLYFDIRSSGFVPAYNDHGNGYAEGKVFNNSFLNDTLYFSINENQVTRFFYHGNNIHISDSTQFMKSLIFILNQIGNNSINESEQKEIESLVYATCYGPKAVANKGTYNSVKVLNTISYTIEHNGDTLIYPKQ